jgi:hypothetical protein
MMAPIFDSSQRNPFTREIGFTLKNCRYPKFSPGGFPMQSTYNALLGYCFAGLFIAGVSSAQAENELVQDMVHLDQVYIPALAFTSDENLTPARASMDLLIPRWNAFRDKYYAESHSDSQWQRDYDKINDYIKAAEKIVAGGTNLKNAHEELEHIRIVFMQLRQRNSIDYYIDYLTRFHEPMEKIVLAAKGKTEATFTSQDMDEIRQALPLAKQLWRAVSNANFDASLYEFDQQKTAILSALTGKEKMALNHLEKVLKTDNKKEIIAAAVAIKPNFAKIFKQFGRFSEIQ